MPIFLSEFGSVATFGYGDVSVGLSIMPGTDIGVIRLSDIKHLSYGVGDLISDHDQNDIQEEPVDPIFLEFKNVEGLDVLLQSLKDLRRQMLGAGRDIISFTDHKIKT